jgi:hypothetical protein
VERADVVIHPALVGPVAEVYGGVDLGFDLGVGFEVDVLLIMVLGFCVVILASRQRCLVDFGEFALPKKGSRSV